MYRKMRGWRHDYHNHIQALKIENVMVDAILNSKPGMIREKRIAGGRRMAYLPRRSCCPLWNEPWRRDDYADADYDALSEAWQDKIWEMPLLLSAFWKKGERTVSVQIGGYGICWGENLCIADKSLYETGTPVALELSDIRGTRHCKNDKSITQ